MNKIKYFMRNAKDPIFKLKLNTAVYRLGLNLKSKKYKNHTKINS